MKILAIGDIFGKSGRQIIRNRLLELKEKHQVDFVVANVENATHGKGISKKHYEELKFTITESGEKKILIDVMTSGNHIFAIEDTKKLIDKVPDLLRPLNFNPYHPGSGTIRVKVKGKRIRVTNLIGTTFMPNAPQNPYFDLEKVLKLQDWNIHLVDFHAEATAEKIALALYFDGEISALWGTHTHVQTADERILLKGTAFITDLGMTGPSEGVIGAKPEAIFRRVKCGFPAKIEPHEDKEHQGQFNGVIFEFDDNSNKVISIKRLNEVYKNKQNT